MISWDWSGSRAERVETGTYRVLTLTRRLPALPGRGILFSPLWVSFSVKRLWDLHPSCIVAFNLVSLLPAVFYRLLRNVPTTLYFLDSYPAAFPTRTPYLIRLIFIAIERFVSRLADFVIFVDEARATQLSFKALPEGSAVVYNSPSVLPSFVRWPSESHSCLRLFYGGGLYEDRGLRGLVNAVGRMPSVQLVIAGEGPLSTMIAQASREYQNVIFVGRVPHEQVMEFTLAADIIPCFYDARIPNNRLASPNKLFEAMALGKYLLTNSGQRAAEYVKKHDIGSIVQYDNEDEIIECLRQLIREPDRLQVVAKRAPRIFDDLYSWKTNLLRLEPYFKRYGL